MRMAWKSLETTDSLTFRASILDFRARLENRCKLFPVFTLFRASILDFKAKLANRCKLFPVYAFLRASILDFIARLGNRCKETLGNSLFRASILDFRARLGNRCKDFPVYALQRASILDFWARLANRCNDFPENNLLRAPILDFRPRLGNRCKAFPVYTLFRAPILDFKAKLGNRCKDFPENNLLRAPILDFRPRLANRCSIIVVAIENGPPAAQSWHLPCRNRRTATTFRVRFYSSSPQRKTARLQRSRGVQAGTGCHEGGIILSKKAAGVASVPARVHGPSLQRGDAYPTTPSTAGPVQTVKTKKLLPNCFGTVKMISL